MPVGYSGPASIESAVSGRVTSRAGIQLSRAGSADAGGTAAAVASQFRSAAAAAAAARSGHQLSPIFCLLFDKTILDMPGGLTNIPVVHCSPSLLATLLSRFLGGRGLLERLRVPFTLPWTSLPQLLRNKTLASCVFLCKRKHRKSRALVIIRGKPLIATILPSAGREAKITLLTLSSRLYWHGADRLPPGRPRLAAHRPSPGPYQEFRSGSLKVSGHWLSIEWPCYLNYTSATGIGAWWPIPSLLNVPVFIRWGMEISF